MQTKIDNEIVGLIGNHEFYNSKSKDGWINNFPPNILIEAENARHEEVHYTPMQFVYKEIDFKPERLFASPISLLFLVNNTCAVDCCYCYCNKQIKADILPFNQVK